MNETEFIKKVFAAKGNIDLTKLFHEVRDDAVKEHMENEVADE